MYSPNCKRITRLMLFVAILLFGLSAAAANRCELGPTVLGTLILMVCTTSVCFGIRELAYLILGDAIRPWYGQGKALWLLVPVVLLVGICSIPVSAIVHEAYGIQGTTAEVILAAMGCTLCAIVLIESALARIARRRQRTPQG